MSNDSVRLCRINRPRPAPNAARTASSFLRVALRASKRLATLAQAISRTNPIELNRLPDGIRGAIEPPFPEPRTDYRDPPIFMPLLLRAEEASRDGPHAQGLKKIRAHVQRFDPLGLSRAPQIDAAFVSPEDGNLLEALHPIPPSPSALIRVRILPLNTWPVDPDQLRRIAIGQ